MFEMDGGAFWSIPKRSSAPARVAALILGNPAPARWALSIGHFDSSDGLAGSDKAAEKDMQLRLETTAKQMGGSLTAASHEVWKRAIEELSSRQIEAVIEYKPTIEAFYGRLEELTGNSHAEQFGAVFDSAVLKTSVMTSVKSIGVQQYTPSQS